MKTNLVLMALGALMLAGCAPTQVENVAGQPTAYEDPTSSGGVQGLGIEPQDVVSMTDQMMRDMMSNAMLVQRDVSPRIIIDSEHIHNDSSTPMNVNLFTNRLRSNLNRAANGQLVFVAREFAHVVEGERELKREGVVDGGTIRSTEATAGADFRLVGNIASQDSVDRDSQTRSRYHQVNFEMLDLELGTIVWSGFYEIRKTGQDNVLYR